MTIGEMIAVLQEAKRGKLIQFKGCRGQLGPLANWQDCSDPTWNFPDLEYRAKPESREWWINVYEPDGAFCHWHPTLDAAVRGSLGKGPEVKERIHVREVIE